MPETEQYGKRNRFHATLRGISFAGIICLVFLFEFFTGGKFEQIHTDEMKKAGDNWAIVNYKSSDGRGQIPPKTKKRIVYISNSHAKTGGLVANHLQNLLNELEPDTYEVLDMADGGIFSPDMLQRMLMSLAYKPDFLILGVAYISFSDRMRLSLQSHSARSFFKKHVFTQLTLGFWARNYDLNIYGNTLASTILKSYRHRSKIRKPLENILVRFLRKQFQFGNILFLQVDENQFWKFPEGYDRNLFQWHLYASGREKHLDDLQDLVRIAKEYEIPLLAFNVPVHWQKSIYKSYPDDVVTYRKKLKKIFADATEYVDYEGVFPKEFSTYDALHPTWHGARLHALDITQRLTRLELLDPNITESNITQSYLGMEKALSDEYRTYLNGQYPPLTVLGFRRFDPFEPKNARKLLRQLNSLQVGTPDEQHFIQDLSLRIRYFRELTFPISEKTKSAFPDSFITALVAEKEKSKIRLEHFSKELIKLQTKRLASFPIPDFSTAELLNEKIVGEQKFFFGEKTNFKEFRITNDVYAKHMSTAEGRDIMFLVLDRKTKRAYQRVDTLGDKSFILLQHVNDPVMIPPWLMYPEPLIQFGI